VCWYGETYKFNKNQAAAIQLIWQADEDPKKVGAHESDIGKVVDTFSSKYRLRDTFRQRRKGKKRGFHPAWNNLIEHMGNGVYRLKAPELDNTASS
jgi:hypothetical protein